MEYDEEMKFLNLTEEEKVVLEAIFKGSEGPDLLEKLPLMIRHNDRTWFDPESGTGICPEILIRFLRNEQPVTEFDANQMYECKFHLEFLPSTVFPIAMKIFRFHRKSPDPVAWEEEGF